MNNRIDPFDELAAMFLTAPQPQPPLDPHAATASLARSVASASATDRSMLTELLVVGHLPVRAGLWLVPYADLLARQVGTVGLIRLDGAEPTLQLLRAPESYATAPLRMPLQQTIHDLSSCVDVWILRGGERLSTDEAIDCRPDRITILSSADEAAIVAAYQTIKELVGAATHPHRTLPSMGMAMVGCDTQAAEAAIDRLNRTTVSFLGVEVKLVALLPRMDAGIKCTRYVTFGEEATPGVIDVRGWIEQAQMHPTTPTEQPAFGHQQPQTRAQANEQAMPPEIAGRISPPPETFVHDARRILRTPAREFEQSPPPALTPFMPTRPAAAASAPTPTSPAVSASPSSPRTMPSAPSPAIVTEAERADLLSAIASGAAGVAGAKLPPKVVMSLEHKPPASQRPIVEPDDRGQPIPLARFVAGLTALPVRPPDHERIELAVDERGRMHLLARESSLRELPVVEQWAHAHRELLAMACTQHRIDPAAGTAVCHVFTSEPATVADLHGSDWHLHVLAPVTLGDRTAWYSAPLNVVK